MDYKNELFAQCTPYLQWLKEQQRQERQNEIAGLGKQVCTLPFSSCMDSVEALLCFEQITEENIYLFAGKEGKLDPNAQKEIAAVFYKNPETAVVYADEDYLGSLHELYGLEEDRFSQETLLDYRDWDTGLYRGNPWFKPEFSPDTLDSFFYIGNVFAVSGTFLKKAWKPQSSLYALVTRIVDVVFADARDKIVHLPHVLYTNNSLSACGELKNFKKLNNEENGRVSVTDNSVWVSVIIPSKDNSEVLGRCLKTLTSCTAYTNYELVIVDNGSSDEQKICMEKLFEEIRSEKGMPEITYLYDPQTFNFSAMCNAGVRAAKGEYLLFLNDDIEVIHPDWMTNMLMCASRSHVGAVGAKLLYPKSDSDNHNGYYRIQHAGITNMAIGPAHKLGGLEDKGNLYHGHNLAAYNMLAVTAACLLIRRDKFELVNGFDEELAVAYNDVELCFKLYKAGFYNILQNDAVLVHHESFSRGQDTSPEKQQRLKDEKRRLYDKHPDLKGKDPFYSPNLVQWKKDVEYNSSYLYACDRPVAPRRLGDKEIRSLPRSHHNKYIKKLTGENLSMLVIDSVELSEEAFVVISGWYVLRNHDNALVEKALLIRVVSDTEDKRVIYELPIAPKMRRDVEVLFDADNNKRYGANTATTNTALCGIQVIVKQSDLLKGRYEIGVLAKTKGRSYVVWSV